MTIKRINYVHNPSFRDGNTYEWAPSFSSGSLEATNETSYIGGYSAKVFKSNGTAYSGIKIAGYKLPVTFGKPYTASAWVRLPAQLESRDFRISISWYIDATDTWQINTTSEVSTVLGADGFTSISFTGYPPDEATYAVVAIEQVIAEAVDLTDPDVESFYKYFYVDAVMFEQSAYVNGFSETISQAEENSVVAKVTTPVPYPAISGLELNADISLNGLILNTIDEDGVIWICSDLQGWWGQPDPEVADIPRGLGDGSYDVRGRYAARQITLTGAFYPPSRELVQSSRDKLIRAVDLVKKGGWLLADEEPTKGAFVRLVGRPTITTVNSRGKTEFEIELRAPDPLKYEWLYGSEFGRSLKRLENGADDIVSNIGNTNVPVILEVHGPLEVDSTIENISTSQTITLATALRGTASLSNVSYVTRSANVATVEFSSSVNLYVGDEVTIAGVGNGFDGTSLLVKSVSNNDDTSVFKITYDNSGSDVTRVADTGTVALTAEDILEIDTYTQEVALNGNPYGYRFYINTLADWIYLQPGDNDLLLDDPNYVSGPAPYLNVYYRSGWIG